MTSEKSRISYDALIVQLPQRMIHKETWFRYVDIVARMRKRLPRTRKKSQIKRQNQTLNSDISSFLKSMKRVNLKIVQTCSKRKTKIEFMDPNDFRQDKN